MEPEIFVKGDFPRIFHDLEGDIRGHVFRGGYAVCLCDAFKLRRKGVAVDVAAVALAVGDKAGNSDRSSAAARTRDMVFFIAFYTSSYFFPFRLCFGINKFPDKKSAGYEYRVHECVTFFIL